MFVIPPVGSIIRRAALLTQVLSTTLVFAVLMVFTIVSWRNAEQTLVVQRQQVINERTSLIEESITQHMQSSGNLLKGGVGIFDGSDKVGRQEWHSFYKKYNIDKNFPGVSTIGYAPVVASSERAAFEASLLADGIPATISPPGKRDVYVPVMYVERFNDTPINYGFDMYSDPVRQEAMDKAKDTASIAMADNVIFPSKQQGVMLYAPVYLQDTDLDSVDQRDQNIHGFVYVGIRVDELLGNVLEEKGKNLGFTVTEDGGRGEVIYTSPNIRGATNLQKVKTSDMPLFGQKWKVSLYADGRIVSTADTSRPSTILAGGIAISVITAVAVYLLIQYRTRSLALIEEHKLQQAKDELLSLASHQLRTPATGVKQYIGMVLDGFAGKVPKQQRELLEQAHKSNERQLQIINEFLYVAKLGSGSLTTTMHRFDLAALVREVVDEMKPDIKERKHRLKVEIPDSLMVCADEHSVRMIVENLVSNASKYTHTGGKVAVRLKRVGRQAQVSVTDDGVGISRNDMQHLFKQFSRIPNELSTEVSGSGIGLYLAQQLAARNDGIITVESEPNKGSTFTLYLPIKTVRKITKTPKKA